MLWLIASYLVMIFLVPLGLSLAVNYRSLPRGRRCPSCAGDTVPLLVRSLRAFNRVIPEASIEPRWCLECGWQGLARATGQPALMAVGTSPAGTSQAGASPAGASPGFTETVDVRMITIDGRSWRVLLQCWGQTRHCYGRLLFIEPTGRLWTDSSEAFSGETRFEVIGQALSAPDGLLASRVRRILSEA